VSNTDTRLTALEHEIKDCRRSAFRDRVVMGGLAALVAVMAIGGMSEPEKVVEEVRTKKLVIVDDKGEARMTLVVLPDGMPRLSMSDEKGESRALFGLSTGDTPFLYMSDDKGEARMTLVVLPDGKSKLDMKDEKGHSRMTLMVLPDGTPILSMKDEKGNHRMTLVVLPDGTPRLDIKDEKGESRALLGGSDTESPDGTITKYPESTLILFGPDGKALWKAP